MQIVTKFSFLWQYTKRNRLLQICYYLQSNVFLTQKFTCKCNFKKSKITALFILTRTGNTNIDTNNDNNNFVSLENFLKGSFRELCPGHTRACR